MAREERIDRESRNSGQTIVMKAPLLVYSMPGAMSSASGILSDLIFKADLWQRHVSSRCINEETEPRQLQ